MNRFATALAILAALIVGAAGSYWWTRHQLADQPPEMERPQAQKKRPLYYRHPMNPEITSPVPAKDDMGMDYIPVYEEEAQAERKILYYRNPMNPEITSPVPAKDQMGMDYVPVYADEEGDSGPAGTVKIDPVTEQTIGVRTAPAERRTLQREVRALGRVSYDETRLVRLHPKVEGWIEEIFVDETGERIDADAILLNIYSPQLVSTEQEYVLALNNYENLKDSPIEDVRRGAANLVETARERLELLDVPEHQIADLERTHKVKKLLHIHAPAKGVIIRIGARAGSYVTPQTELYTIADLSTVWVYVDVYEDELPWVRLGDEAEMTLTALPGEVFRGKLTYIYPYAESKTRTIKVRMEFDNPRMLLKPEMYADVTIHASRQFDAVVVPSEAIIRSGTRDQVFVVRGHGKFEPREVKLGVSDGGFTQIREGVEPGEQVVVSAQFLIDSESKLREAAAKMRETGLKTGAAPGSDTDEDETLPHREMNHD